MARKASSTTSGGESKNRAKSASKSRPGTKPARAVATRRRSSGGGGFDASAAVLKLLQSPLVADLLAVAATAALAALAEHGFSRSGGDKRRAGRAVKEAGKAAAIAIGRRLSNEFDEVRKAAKTVKDAAR